MPKSQFVSKSYEARSDLHQNNVEIGSDTAITREEFIKDKAFNEFAGSKFYETNCEVPKIYISGNESETYRLHSRRIYPSKTLGEYLYGILKEIKPELRLQDVGEKFQELIKIEENKQFIAQEINKIQGLGELCFMAMLLGDRDVFGSQLDNVRICFDANEKPFVVKLDTEEVDLTGGEFKTEIFSESVNRLSKEQGFFAHYVMPFFDDIYSLLDEKQKDAGIKAIERIDDQALADINDWISKKLSFSEEKEKTIGETLAFRRNLLIETFDPHQVLRDKIKIKDINQKVVFRPSSDFIKTGEKYSGGNAQPDVTEKIRSEKKRDLLKFTEKQIGEMIEDLKRKSLSMVDKKGKADKRKNLDGAISDLITLKSGLEIKDKSIHTLEEITHVFHRFNQITDTLGEQLTNDPTEKGILKRIRRSLSDSLKKLKSNSSQFSSIHTVEFHKQALNKEFFSFFNHHAIPVPKKSEKSDSASAQEKAKDVPPPQKRFIN